MKALRLLAAPLLLLIGHDVDTLAQTRASGIRAVPLEARTAILDAFRLHRFVGIGDAHGNTLGETFQLALLRDPRFSTVVNDILVEGGNSRHQALVDRFVRGEDIRPEALQPVWLDTTQQQVASSEVPALFSAVRSINAGLAPARRLRVLLGEPSIEWERIRTVDDLRKWEAEPLADRDRFAVDLVRKEVFAENRKVLALYGAGHLFRKVISESLVTLLEDGKTKVFTIWTNAAAEMATMQPDVGTWPVPSLTHVRGTILGEINIAEYFGPSGKDIPPQWRAPMQDQFDAVLYVGPLTTITLERPKPWRCSDPAMEERLRRLRLQRPSLADRVQQECVR
jgi:DNA-binding TFAR19-related protein (PDSD5 family)